MTDGDIRNYGVIGNTVVRNSGASKIFGDLNYVSSLSGAGTLAVTRQINSGAISTNAQSQYDYFMSISPNTTSSATNIGNTTFNPGYNLLTNTNVTIGGVSPLNTVTLDGPGLYVFQIPNGGLTTTTTSAPVSFNFVNGAVASDVYWMIFGDVNIQTQSGNITTFIGSIITQGNITLGTSCSSAGSLIAESGTVTLNSNVITSQTSQQLIDNLPNEYVILQTSMPDSQAIQISASNANGGIYVHAGFGGIAVDTTNAISLIGNAACDFITTGGNLALQSQSALVNIDGGSGINIGCDNLLATIPPGLSITTPIINIGSSASSKTITIGNATGTTQVNVLSGTGGINLSASNTGGINLNTATGGTISLNAIGANSNFTLSSNATGQNLSLALINTLGGSNDSKIVLDSQGTGAEAIKLTSVGGVTVTTPGIVNVVSTDVVGGAITLDTSFAGGGINIAAGSLGIAVNANGGLIGIGHWSGGDIQLGTASVARTITIGNTTGNTSLTLQAGTGAINIGNDGVAKTINVGNTVGNTSLTLQAGTGAINIGNDGVAKTINIGNAIGTTNVNVHSGTFGITIGNDENGGEIQIGQTTSTAKTITTGNSNGATQLIQRFGTGGLIRHQEPETALSDVNTTLTMAQLLTRIITINPSVNRTLILPDGTGAVAGVSHAIVGDSFDFTIINQSPSATGAFISIATGVNGSAVGNMSIAPVQDNLGTYFTSGSGTLRLRYTNTTGGPNAYTVYRIS